MKNSVFLSISVAAACVLAGCGDDAKPTDPADKLAGEWEYVSGKGTITCPVIPQMELPWMGKLAFQRGTDAGALQTDKQIADQRCTLKLGMMGTTTTASALPGQMCNVSAMFMNMAISAVMTVSSYTFTLSADGTMLTEMGAGMATGVGIPITCQFASTGQLKKVQ